MVAVASGHPALQDAPEPPGFLELTAAQLRDWPLPQPPVVVDVREAWEVELCRLPDAQHIPLGELAGRAVGLASDLPTVLVCHHGMRSAAAARYLAGLGFERVFNLVGGIDAWAASVDPDMRRY
jgi:rhodanese-related sulfurtransferase